MKILKNDNVIMLSGKDRGKKGKVLSVVTVAKDDDRHTGRVVVEGLNMMKKHTRARQQGQSGQIINKERAVSAASVALICKSCGKATRVGYRMDGENKVRICKKCGSTV